MTAIIDEENILENGNIALDNNTSDVVSLDSNNNVEYAHDDQSIIINNPERRVPQRFRKQTFKRKRYEPI